MILFYFVIVLTTKQLFFFIKLTNFDNCLVTINDKNNLTILKSTSLKIVKQVTNHFLDQFNFHALFSVIQKPFYARKNQFLRDFITSKISLVVCGQCILYCVKYDLKLFLLNNNLQQIIG